MTPTLRKGVLALAACVSCLLAAAPAQAAFHLMKIREISSSGLGATNDAYVMLQMTTAGQNQVAGHILTVYDEDGIGGPSATFTIPAGVALGDNQRTILVGDTAVANRDITWDALSPLIGAGNLGSAGALCFPEASPPDCVSWGGFTGAALLPDGATPVPGPLPITEAFRRSISPGCATLLEPSDDTNLGSDFSVTPREPRGNASSPTEKLCDSSGPTQKLTAKKKQDVDKAAVSERLDEAGKVVLKGRVSVPAAGGNDRSIGLAARAVKTKRAKKFLVANQKTKIRIKLSRSAKKKVKAAIEASGPRRIRVTATATDALGNSSTKRVSFKLTD